MGLRILRGFTHGRSHEVFPFSGFSFIFPFNGRPQGHKKNRPRCVPPLPCSDSGISLCPRNIFPLCWTGCPWRIRNIPFFPLWISILILFPGTWITSIFCLYFFLKLVYYIFQVFIGSNLVFDFFVSMVDGQVILLENIRYFRE